MSHSFEETVLMVVNLGDDSDTTAAVVGQLAGAYYAFKNIPESWIVKIAMKEKILQLAENLFTNRNQF